MASGMTPAKRFAVRTTLVAGSTLAMVVGAQSLILLDTTSANTVASSAASVGNITANTSTDTVESNVATSTISIIRPATTTNVVALVPTVQVVQQVSVPTVPTTRSSR